MVAALLAAVTVVLTVVGCTAGPSDGVVVTTAPAGHAPPGVLPGAPLDGYYPELGDPGYQAEHYDLAVRYDPVSDELTGQITMRATAAGELPVLRLDLIGLTVTEVRVDGVPARTAREAGKLVVTPAAPVPAGAGFTVEVTYHGVPEPVREPQLGTNGFHHTEDGAFALGQPRSASTWFPVNDHPSDKATYAFEITVPEGLVAVANGAPAGRHTSQGWTTWRWRESAPMASYLVTLVVGDYRLSESTHRGLPVVVAVHASLPAGIDAQLARTGEIADRLAQWFGPYPFSAYGGVVLADQRVGFALETQSRPVYGPAFFAGGADGTWVIVHELAHQWFGDSVTVRQWRDIWLNEGFATYAEWLWEEAHGGDTVTELFDLYWGGPGAEPEFWTVPPGDPGPDRLFHSAVYLRGAMTVHALRLAVGDEAFFEILAAWTREYQYRNVTTEDFITLCERVAGRDLGTLFDHWLYAPVQPTHPGR